MKALTLLLTVSFVIPSTIFAQLDSLKAALAKAPNDSVRFRLLDDISFKYSRVNPDSGIAYANIALDLATKKELKREQGSALTMMAINQESASHHDAALINYEKAKNLYQEAGYLKGVAAVLGNMSQVYMNQGLYPNALDLALDALTILDQLDEPRMNAQILEKVGNIYFEQKSYDLTLTNYFNALHAYEELGDQHGIARLYGNLGRVHNVAGNFSEAIQFHHQALEMNQTLNNKFSQRINLANLGHVYYQNNVLDSALHYQEMALKLSSEAEDQSSIAVDLGNIGSTHLAMAKAAEGAQHRKLLALATKQLEESVLLCRQLNFQGPLIEFAESLSEAYALQGSFKEAYESFRLFTATRDSVHSKEAKIMIADLQLDRDLQLKEKDLEIQNRQLEINRLEASNKRNERAIFMMGLLFLLVLVFLVVYKLVRHVRRQNSILEDITYLQAHQVRGPVARILGLSYLLNREDPSDPGNKEVIDLIYKSTLQLDEVIHQVVDRTATEPVRRYAEKS